MDIEEAFQKIPEKLKAASARGLKPSIRAAGKDWVCTVENQQTKFNVIAKDGELLMVSVESKGGAPHVTRIPAPGSTQQQLIDQVKKIVAEVFGA
jgi:hypothetical protein